MKPKKLIVYKDKTFFQDLEPKVWEFFLSTYNTQRISKSSSKLMKIIATILSIVTHKSKKEFMEKYTTTVGSRIYIPYKVGTAKEPNLVKEKRAILSIITCAHEHVHVMQYRQNKVRFLWKYLTSSLHRALYEAEAYRCNLQLDNKLESGVIGIDKILSSLTGYGCSKDDIDHAREYLLDYHKVAKHLKHSSQMCVHVRHLVKQQYPSVEL